MEASQKGIVINPGPDGCFNAVQRSYEDMLTISKTGSEALNCEMT